MTGAGAQYDDAGYLTNVTLGQVHQFEHDGLGMVKSLQTLTGTPVFVYDASNERVLRRDCALDLCGPHTSKEHITIRGLGGEVLRIYEGTERADRHWVEDMVYRGGQPLVRIVPEGTEKRGKPSTSTTRAPCARSPTGAALRFRGTATSPSARKRRPGRQQTVDGSRVAVESPAR